MLIQDLESKTALGSKVIFYSAVQDLKGKTELVIKYSLYLTGFWNYMITLPVFTLPRCVLKPISYMNCHMRT